jgi:hypothetical protein
MPLTLLLLIALISIFISEIRIGNKRVLTIVLSIILLVSFFLPYFGHIWRGASGYTMVANYETVAGSWERYIWLFIPVSAILLLIGAFNKERYIVSRKFLSLLPLLTIIFICIWLRTVSFSYETLISWLGFGFWVSILASLFLVFYNPQKKYKYRSGK